MDLAGSANIQTTCKREMVQPRAEDCAPSPTLRTEGSAVSLAPPLMKKGVCNLQHPLNTATRPRNTNSLSSEAEGTKLKGLSNLVSGNEASLGDGVSPPSAGTLLGQDSAPSLIGNGSADDAPPTSIVKVPKKRGRKSKAELLLIKAAQDQMEAMLPIETKEKEGPELEHTPSGRPRRRAAKEALKYLHDIAEELTSPGSSSPTRPERPPPEVKEEQALKRRSNKRKRRASDDDGDLDFVVSEDFLREEEEREEEAEHDGLSDESEEDVNSYNMSVFRFGEKPYPQPRGLAENGFHNSIMFPVWHSAEVTMDFRNLHHSDWEFPEWLPFKNSWEFLSERDADSYLPQHLTSPLFSIQREGIKEKAEPCVLSRFQSLPPNPDRWDITCFVGGPVWSMEWCPTPAGSGACQYLALYCHHEMDARHQLHVTHRGPALLQLWSLGNLGLDSSCDSVPSFCYGLAVDEGCIWDMKFCPSGGWELPSTSRKNTQMARLGLLAVAFSSGHVGIYSLPHPDSLQSHRKSQVKDPWKLTICKVECVVRLYVGSIKACNPGENGQCFCLSWVHSKPHQFLAAGFHDGTVSIWDLMTKSVLQKVRQGHVVKQYPFLSFLAHNQAVRSIEWCKVDSNFLVTCSGERCLKFWDLRRLAAPINDFRRFQSTEITWLLPYCGVVVAQDNCHAAHGQCGVHYVDSGFMGYKSFFAAPRRGTVWSVSGSDWLGTVIAGDITGEVMAIVMPFLNVPSINAKRPSDRRFPIYKVDFESLHPPSDITNSDNLDLPSGQLAENDSYQHFKPKSFRAAAGRFHLSFQDADLRSFKNLPNMKSTKRMRANEIKGELNFDRIQLESIHKVRFSPNLDSYTWMASGGHSGLVRVHCIRGMVTAAGQEMLQEKRQQFQALYKDTHDNVPRAQQV